MSDNEKQEWCRESLTDFIWEALDNANDMDVGLTDFANAVVEAMHQDGLLPPILAALNRTPPTDGLAGNALFPQRCIAQPGEPGDCYRACLATITGHSIASMPNFGKDNRNDPENMEAMWDEVREYLAPYGLAIFNDYCNGEWSLEKVLEYFSEYNAGVPIILTGRPAHHSDPAHSVVALNGKIVHDPSGAGISGPCGEWWHFDVVALAHRDAALTRTPPTDGLAGEMMKCAIARDCRNSSLDRREVPLPLFDRVLTALSQQRLDPLKRERDEARWQPIETAPKDGSRLIVAKHGWTHDMGDLKQGSDEWRALFFDDNAPRKYHCWWVSRGYWDADRQKWTNGLDALNEPTHWMPDLAPPPVCQVPPEGWCCTRAVGHDGPCAAYPARIEAGTRL